MGAKKKVLVGTSLALALTLNSVGSINANGLDNTSSNTEIQAKAETRGITANLGQQYIMTWGIADNGASKTYDVNLPKSGNLLVKVGKFNFATGQELQWKIQLLNSSGQVIKTNNITDFPVSGTDRVITYTGLSTGKYSVKLDPNLHMSAGSLQVPISFSQDGNVDTTDWKNHWAKEAIQKAMDRGWVDKADKFRPDDNLTRAEMVKIINIAYGFTKTGNEPFSDVNPGDWYYEGVKIALANGAISSDTKFRPNDKITRQEFAVIVSNIETNKKGDPNHDKYKNYSDYTKAGNWAKDSIEYVIEKGYMGAGGKVFNPTSNITRAEAVTTLSRVK